MRTRRAWTAVAAFTVMVAVAGSVWAAQAVASDDSHQAQRSLQTSASDVESTLHLTDQRLQDLVASVSSFVAGNPDVTNGALGNWASSVGATRRYPGLQGVGVVDYVPRADLASFAQRAQADPAGSLGPDGTFSVIPPGNRLFYCLAQAVGYTAPGLSPNPAGLDLCTTPLGPVFLRARDTGETMVVPDALGGPPSVIVETPVYWGGTTPDTVAQRQAELVAEIGVGMSPSAWLDSALAGHRDLAATLHYQGVLGGASFSPEYTRGRVAGPARTLVFNLGNGWTARISGPEPGSGIFSFGNAVALLVAGLLLSLLLGALTRVLYLSHLKNQESRFRAGHDALTGLPNRTLILDRIDQMLARNRRLGTSGAALFVDLDEFKNVNDTIGHEAGDQLIRSVADRLSGALEGAFEEGATIGRMGGDEFVILLEGGLDGDLDGDPEPMRAERVAARLLDAVRQPFDLGLSAWPLTVTASVGVATGDRGSAGELLRDADLALYQAKAAGKNCYQVFRPEMQEAFRRRLQREFELRSALQAGQFRLDYQPILDLRTGAVEGVEALLRWEHPTAGTILPSQFIPLAEAAGLVVPIGEWVLGEACRQINSWRHAHAELRDLSVSVNLSGCQIAQADFLPVVANVLGTTGLPPDRLVLEITESVLMRDADTAVGVLAALKALGVRIAIDDFGTGYSSLSYLRKFPADILKIDKAFVDGLAHGAEDSAIVGATITLAHALGLATTAEGVEKVGQARVLAALGCDKVQGYLFARPGPAPAVLDELLSRRSGAVGLDNGLSLSAEGAIGA